MNRRLPLHPVAIAAMGLGLLWTTTHAPMAMAYPSGATVSAGENPIRSAGAVVSLDDGPSFADVIAAPADQDLVLTDIVLGIATQHESVRCSGTIELRASDGTVYGAYALNSGRIDVGGDPGGSKQYAGASGIRIPAGTSVSLYWTFRYRSTSSPYWDLAYTLSGYLAQP
jgi:hypothetical protein